MLDEDAAKEARADEREGELPFTQASESVSEEWERLRESEYGARATEQAIAIGLSRPSEATIAEWLPPKRGRRSAKKRPSHPRSRTIKHAPRRKGRAAATRGKLSGRAKNVSRRRAAGARSRSAKKAGRTRKKRR